MNDKVKVEDGISANQIFSENMVDVKEEFENDYLDNKILVHGSINYIHSKHCIKDDKRKLHEILNIDIKTESTSLEVHNQLSDEFKRQDKTIAILDIKNEITILEVMQCPFCEIYLNQQEYLENHLNSCEEKIVRFVKPSSTDQAITTNKCTRRQPTVEKSSKCKYNTSFRTDRKAHTSRRYQLKTYSCSVCCRRFKNKEALKLHVSDVHINIVEGKVELCLKNQLKYASCQYKTCNGSLLKLQHQQSKRFKCSECEFKSNYSQRLKSHVNAKHCQVKKYRCPNCDYETAYSSNLKDHLYSHEKVKRFKCTQCEFETNYKRNLKSHFYTHEAVKRFKCSECVYGTNNKANLKQHLNVRHSKGEKYKCLKCEFKTNYNWHLKRHMNAKHSEAKTYKCSFCDFETNYKWYLRTHTNAKHSATETSAKYKCSACDFETNYNWYLKSHVNAKHCEGKTYKCPKCEYETSYKSTLKNHMYLHEEMKQFQCPQCDYETNYKAVMKKHIKIRYCGDGSECPRTVSLEAKPIGE